MSSSSSSNASSSDSDEYISDAEIETNSNTEDDTSAKNEDDTSAKNEDMDTTKDATPEEIDELLKKILAIDDNTGLNKIRIITSDKKELIIPNRYQTVLKLIKDLIEDIPLQEDITNINLDRIDYQSMNYIADLCKISLYNNYPKQITKNTIFRKYLEPLWDTLNEEGISVFVYLANGAVFLNFEDINEAMADLFLDKIDVVTPGKEYREFRKRIGFPENGGFDQAQVEEIIASYPPAEEWLKDGISEYPEKNEIAEIECAE